MSFSLSVLRVAFDLVSWFIFTNKETTDLENSTRILYFYL